MHNIYEHLNYAIALFKCKRKKLKGLKLFIFSNVKIKNECFLSLKISVLRRQFFDFFYFTLIINSLINI